MGFKGHPPLGQFAQPGETHHLKAATVGQDRPLPVHKLMQASKMADTLGCGPQHQMIGVAQQNISTRGAY